MKTVAYTCPYVPAEWIVAHRLRPKRISPSFAAAAAGLEGPGIGLCPYARAFVHAARRAVAEGGAAIFTTVCDQMRRASELCEGAHGEKGDKGEKGAKSARGGGAVFLMNVPSTWQTDGARNLYRAELERLGRFLVRLGSVAPTPTGLAAAMREAETARRELLRGPSHPRQGWPTQACGVPVAIVGGPMAPEHLTLFDVIEKAGGVVALDATESGERTQPAPFDEGGLRNDPLGELVRAYFGHIPDAFRRPNTGLYEWLGREIAARGVRGVIFWRHVWCDIWHAEARRMKEWLAIPLMEMVASDDGAINGHAISRIQAFMELLK